MCRMGGLCSWMANVVAAERGDEERPGKKEEDGDENWEDEVDMNVFYTDAVKYWEVCRE